MKGLPLTKRVLLMIVAIGTLLGAGIAGVFTFNGTIASAQTNGIVETAEDEADEVAPAGLGLTEAEAQAIIETANPDATVLEMEYEEEGGVQMYEAELDNGSEILIDANTGEILASEVSDAD